MKDNSNKFSLGRLAYWAGFASKHADTQKVIAEFKKADMAAEAALQRSRTLLGHKP